MGQDCKFERVDCFECQKHISHPHLSRSIANAMEMLQLKIARTEGGVLTTQKPKTLPFISFVHEEHSLRRNTRCSSKAAKSESEIILDEETTPRTLFNTGTMDWTTSGATRSFANKPLTTEKLVVFIRHGYSTWNKERRIQGASEISELTDFGEEQAAKCKAALNQLHFDNCFTSPIKRAKRTAEIVWSGRDGDMIPIDELREADLGILQGMKNDVAAVEYAELYRMWREQPADFCIDGRYPVRDVFDQADIVWQKILETKGTGHLVVTHKSILRAMLCTALGLPTSSFRAIDINNGGICVFRINKKGEPMLTGLNLTSHLHVDGVRY